MMNEEILQLAEQAGQALLERKLLLVTAESCTGGWVSEAITAIAGSSQWFDRGFVTYSNQAKREMLGVAEETLSNFGAVSEQTVREMVAGALQASVANAALAVSGIAGPGGALPGKPVGTVCFAWTVKSGAPITETWLLAGDRTAIRRQAVIIALQGVLRLV